MDSYTVTMDDGTEYDIDAPDQNSLKEAVTKLRNRHALLGGLNKSDSSGALSFGKLKPGATGSAKGDYYTSSDGLLSPPDPAEGFDKETADKLAPKITPNLGGMDFSFVGGPRIDFGRALAGAPKGLNQLSIGAQDVWDRIAAAGKEGGISDLSTNPYGTATTDTDVPLSKVIKQDFKNTGNIPSNPDEEKAAFAAKMLPLMATPAPEAMLAKILMNAGLGAGLTTIEGGTPMEAGTSGLISGLIPGLFGTASHGQLEKAAATGLAPEGRGLVTKGLVKLAAPFKENYQPELEALLQRLGITKPPLSAISNSPTVADLESSAAQGMGGSATKKDLEKSVNTIVNQRRALDADVAEAGQATKQAKEALANEASTAKASLSAEKTNAGSTLAQEQAAARAKLLEDTEKAKSALAAEDEMTPAQAAAQLMDQTRNIGTGDPELAGLASAESADAARQAGKANYRQKYAKAKELDRPVPVDTAGSVKAAKDALLEESKAAIANGTSLPADAKRLKGFIKANTENGKPTELPSDVFGAGLKKLKAEIKNWGRRGEQATGDLAEKKAQIAARSADLQSALETNNPAYLEAKNAADSAFRTHINDTNHPVVKKIFELANNGQYDKIVDTVFDKNISRADIPRVMGMMSDEGKTEVQRQLIDRIVNAGTKDGKLNPKALIGAIDGFDRGKLSSILSEEQMSMLDKSAQEMLDYATSSAGKAEELATKKRLGMADITQQGLKKKSDLANQFAQKEADLESNLSGKAADIENEAATKAKGFKGDDQEISLGEDALKSAKKALGPKDLKEEAIKTAMLMFSPKVLAAKILGLPAKPLTNKLMSSDIMRKYLTKGFQLPNIPFQHEAVTGPLAAGLMADKFGEQ